MESVENIDGDKFSLSLSGDMTIYDAENIKKTLMNAVFGDGKNIEINLSGVEEIDTCGMQVLMLAKRESGKLEKELKMVAHSPAVLELMDVFQLSDYFGDPLVMSKQ